MNLLQNLEVVDKFTVKYGNNRQIYYKNKTTKSANR